MSFSFPHGPRFDEAARARLEGLEYAAAGGPSVRGWVLSLVSCAVLGVVVPYVDNVVHSTRLSLNLLPASSLLLTLTCVLVLNALIARGRVHLGLKRQDVAFIFCTTMLVNPLPSLGFLGYLSAAQMGPFYYARPENNWEKLLHPHIPEALAPRDPADPLAFGPRPVEWFFGGLPEGQSIPWGALALPYARWCLALVLVLTMFFSLAALLHRQWSQRERLPFPLVQVPVLLMEGLFERARERPFALRRLFWWGVAVTFFLHAYNALGDYVVNWPSLPLRIEHIDGTYLTERPWRHMRPYRFNIYPSVIGIMYLISLEVSFSLWFFFAAVLKVGVLIAVLGFGMGWDQWYFHGTEGPRSIFTAQGTGACLALVLAGFVMARSSLWRSLKQALGLLPAGGASDELSPRAVWLLLAAGLAGSAAWLCWAGVSWHWALAATLLLLLSATGVARLVAEGGVFFLQMQAGPADIMNAAFTPVALGPGNLVLLSLWSRVFVFDWYRSCPMINLLGALHLGDRTGLRPRPLLAGLAAALLIVFTLGFFTFYYTAYTQPGGARGFGWTWDGFPRGEGRDWADKVAKVEAFKAKQAAYQARGLEIAPVEVPDVARTDWKRLSWMLVGGVTLCLFLALRSRVFWWPHPIGYVMWMGLWPMTQMWFSYFLGWLVKLLLVRFGGRGLFLAWRPFFVGLILGEALATLLWVAIAAILGRTGGYTLEFN